MAKGIGTSVLLILGVIALIFVVAVMTGEIENPFSGGSDTGLLSVVPTDTTVYKTATELPCDTAQDCVDIANAQGAPEDQKAECVENLCVFITEVSG